MMRPAATVMTKAGRLQAVAASLVPGSVPSSSALLDYQSMTAVVYRTSQQVKTHIENSSGHHFRRRILARSAQAQEGLQPLLPEVPSPLPAKDQLMDQSVCNSSGMTRDVPARTGSKADQQAREKQLSFHGRVLHVCSRPSSWPDASRKRH